MGPERSKGSETNQGQEAESRSQVHADFDMKGMVLVEFLPPGETVDSDSYIDTLRRLRENTRRKRPELWGPVRRGQPCPFLLHHDNASSHTSAPTLGFIGENDMEMLAHPPYSPDLAPCDFFLFPRLKNELRGHRFRTIADLQQAVHRTLRTIPAEDFESALMSLPVRWMKCVSAEGHYFEGRHLQVDPGEHGLEILTVEDSETTSEDSDSDKDDQN